MIQNFEKFRKVFSAVFVVMVFGYFLIATVAFAVVVPGTPTGATDSTGGSLSKPDDESIGVGVTIPGEGIESLGEYKFSVYVRAIYAFSMKVAIALSTLMVVYAGYKYLTSRGETGAINEAKDILFSTLMGAALLMLVLLIANIAGLNLNLPS